MSGDFATHKLLMQDQNSVTVIVNLWRLRMCMAKTISCKLFGLTLCLSILCFPPPTLNVQAYKLWVSHPMVMLQLSPVNYQTFILCSVMSSYSVSSVIILSVLYIHMQYCSQRLFIFYCIMYLPCHLICHQQFSHLQNLPGSYNYHVQLVARHMPISMHKATQHNKCMYSVHACSSKKQIPCNYLEQL